MVSLKFKSTINIDLDSKNIKLTDLVEDALTSFGFLKVSRNADSVTFKHDIKDANLESFQRRYGDGEISIDRNNLTISTETKYSRTFAFSIVFLLVLIILTILIKLNRIDIAVSTSNSVVIITAFIVSSILEYVMNRSLILNRQKKLLEMIAKFIKNKIKPAQNNGQHEEPLHGIPK